MSKMRCKFALIKRNGQERPYSHSWPKRLIRIAADTVLDEMTDEDIDYAEKRFYQELLGCNTTHIPYEQWRDCLRRAMTDFPEVLNAFLFAHTEEKAFYFDEICTEISDIYKNGDRSNGSMDSSLCSSKRALTVETVEKKIYQNYHLTDEQKEAYNTGYIYIHDMGHRRDSINCCLFDMETVLNNGFEMGEMWYEEPQTLREAFDVIGNVSLNAAAQIYGGFTISQIDELLAKYAKKSFKRYIELLTEKNVNIEVAQELAKESIVEDFRQGFFALEEKFNSIISPRGDYPFITITFGLCQDEYAIMASEAAIFVRESGHGADGHKKPVLFPKLVFLFDKKMHGKDGELYYLFRKALECSSKVMYPEYLSLSGGKGIVSEVYKEYGKVISPMCCRAFLNKWFEKGGGQPADENDNPIFIGRFNIGVVSLNLPMILAKSRKTGTDFYDELDYYLNMARDVHKSTYHFLSRKKAHTNPLAFMQGGIYGGHLSRNDTIGPLLKSATASFGFTALNELQRLYNGKSLVQDGDFALDVLKHINKKTEEFRTADHIQYTVYGTPAESLCGRQARQFREEFGSIKNVSDRDYFSNSFHCHVSENISPIEKQEYEARFWDYANGGKIQYIRLSTPHNIQALEEIVLHAMDLGLYEGINISLAYCNNCDING